MSAFFGDGMFHEEKENDERESNDKEYVEVREGGRLLSAKVG